VTNRRPLLERLAELDPAPPERISEVARDESRLRAEITSAQVDELASRRRLRGRRVMTAVAAAIVAVGLIVPVAILLPLAGNETTDPRGAGAEPPVTASDRIEVLSPAPDTRVSSPVIVSGTADVFEATVSIRILDGMNNVIADTFTTATCGSGCRGDFEAEVPFSVGTEQPGVIQVFEESAEDGSRLHVVRIPVTLVPGPDDPIAPAGDPPVTSSETIEVLAPAPDARVSSPVTVSGTANVFEATVMIRILDANENVVADTFTTATCGSGCWGDFEAEVPFSVGTEQPGVIQVFQESAEDGSRLHVVRIPVTLVPGA
jgi:hypothetical protein